MAEVLLLVLREASDAGMVAASGNPLDISISCRRLGERIENAASTLGLRLAYADSIEDAYLIVSRAEEDAVVFLDALAAYPDHVTVLREALDAYAEKPGETIVFVTRPYLDRGVKVSVNDDRLGDVESGVDAFAGIIVSRRSALLDAMRGASDVSELLSSLRGSMVHYWREPWLRLEKPHDPLFYAMLLASRIRGVRIAPGARVSPTAVIEGPVVIEDGVTLDHYAVVKGPVILCRGAFVGLHATVRGYTLLEPGARIGAYGESYVTLMEPGASASSHTYLTGSVIGENAHVEPFVVTKVVYGEEAGRAVGVLAPIAPEIRTGAVVAAGARVKAGSILEPLSIVR